MPGPPYDILEPSRRAIPAQSFLCDHLRPCLQPHCDHLLPLYNPVFLQLLSLRVLPAKPPPSQSAFREPEPRQFGPEVVLRSRKGNLERDHLPVRYSEHDRSKLRLG